jgi:hypothetical protein
VRQLSVAIGGESPGAAERFAKEELDLGVE